MPTKVVLNYESNGRPWVVTGQFIEFRQVGDALAIELLSDRFHKPCGFMLDDTELVSMQVTFERIN